jgi:hypothetical protein
MHRVCFVGFDGLGLLPVLPVEAACLEICNQKVRRPLVLMEILVSFVTSDLDIFTATPLFKTRTFQTCYTSALSKINEMDKQA